MDSILKTMVFFSFFEVMEHIWDGWDHFYNSDKKRLTLALSDDIEKHSINIFYINEKGETVRELRYQRLLCCVIQKIENNSETKNELYIRFWEECVDSLGMCFQGHMSRLCNVFSGFDPDLPLVASRGEQIQAAFQDLSTKKITFSEKKEEAFKIFEKFLIEDEEAKEGWLSALDLF
jgi:hypothetical protein